MKTSRIILLTIIILIIISSIGVVVWNTIIASKLDVNKYLENEEKKRQEELNRPSLFDQLSQQYNS